jgi:hypothetical protein
VRAYTDLPRIALEQIQHFFEHYKDLEPGKWVKIIGREMWKRRSSLSAMRSVESETATLICPCRS